MINLMYFKAAWCGPCKSLSPMLTEVVNGLGNLPMITIDIDERPEMALQYGVQSVPTLIVVKDGAEAFRQSGLVTRGRLMEVLRQFASAKQVLNG